MSVLPRILRTLPALRGAVADWRRGGATVGVVPTMGALHRGHLSLVDAARARADRVIVTLFVNPKQFDDPDDLARYPRTEREDAAALAGTGADVLYLPDPASIYPAGFATTVSVAGPSRGLDGDARPGHFDGVATVVAKLLLQTDADFGFFGEKDFQQLLVVRRLVRDLDIDCEIIGCPTVRDADGLALSSRNLRLSPAQRHIAPRLHAALHAAADRIAAGHPVAAEIAACRGALQDSGFGSVDYLELRAADTLGEIAAMTGAPARLLGAAWLGEIRLIDNVVVPPLIR